MGVGDFQAFLEREPSLRVGVTSLDLVRAAWAREGKGGARPGRQALVSGRISSKLSTTELYSPAGAGCGGMS